MAISEPIAVEMASSTATITFKKPELRNPLSRSVLAAIYDVIDSIGHRDEIDRLVFIGSSDAFASGADLNEIREVDEAAAPAFARYGQDLMTRIAGLKIVTIAAINGFCFGGGLDLALSCRYRIASPAATFAHPGARLGIITGWGGTQRLPRLVGRAAALEMFFTAAPINADRALGIGLIDSVHDDPLAAALAFNKVDADKERV